MNKTIEFERLKKQRKYICDKMGKQPENPKLKAELDAVNIKIKNLNLDAATVYSAISFSK